MLRFSNSVEVYSGTYIKYDEQNGVALFASPGHGIIRTLTVERGDFNVQSHNNYDMTHNRNVLNLPAGKYYVYGTVEDIAVPEPENFFCEVCEVDSSYKTIKLIPSSSGKPYFYLAKCVYGAWQGWEKYSSG